MGAVLNIISVIATFIVAEGIIFSVLNLIFGRIKLLNKRIYDGIRLKHIIFLLIGVIVILIFFEFNLPW